MRLALRERRDVLVAAVQQCFGAEALTNVPRGGFHLWVRLPSPWSDIEFVRVAATRGVIVSAGSNWFPAEPPGSFLRLTFAGANSDQLRRGVGILSTILADSPVS
jgi:DNA-binding transcriptional MocR family regulator